MDLVDVGIAAAIAAVLASFLPWKRLFGRAKDVFEDVDPRYDCLIAIVEAADLAEKRGDIELSEKLDELLGEAARKLRKTL